jgi:hypothetical protein
MKKLFLLLLMSSAAFAQNSPIALVTTAPSGACKQGLPDEQVFSTGLLFSCQSGTWTQIGAGGGGGTGTVTSVTDSSGLFSVANPTTTPTFTYNTEAANTFLAGPSSGGAVAPFFRAIGLADLPSTVLAAAGTPTANLLTKWVTSSTIGNSSISDNGTTVSFTEPISSSAAGALSAPSFTYTGVWGGTSGTGTTTVPFLLFQPTGTTAATTWSTANTALGMNAASGFTGMFLDFKVNGAATSAFSVGATGLVQATQVIRSLVGFQTNVASGGLFELNSNGAVPSFLTSSAIGNLTVGTTNGGNNGSYTGQHYIGGGTAVTVAPGLGAGTGATAVCLSGATCLDSRGRVLVTFGTTPAAGAVATVTFATAYGIAPTCVVNQNAGTITTNSGSSTSTTVLTINVGLVTGLVSTNTQEYDYVCVQ